MNFANCYQKKITTPSKKKGKKGKKLSTETSLFNDINISETVEFGVCQIIEEIANSLKKYLI